MFIVTDQATTSSEMDAKWCLLEPSALQARTALDKGEEDTAASVTRHCVLLPAREASPQSSHTGQRFLAPQQQLMPSHLKGSLQMLVCWKKQYRVNLDGAQNLVQLTVLACFLRLSDKLLIQLESDATRRISKTTPCTGGVKLGLYWGYVRVILGVYCGYVGFVLGLYWHATGHVNIVRSHLLRCTNVPFGVAGKSD